MLIAWVIGSWGLFVADGRPIFRNCKTPGAMPQCEVRRSRSGQGGGFGGVGPPGVQRELVLEGVDQGEPARLDDVLGDADGAPDVVGVLALDDHADPGGGAGAGVDDADLVI